MANRIKILTKYKPYISTNNEGNEKEKSFYFCIAYKGKIKVSFKM